MAYSTPLNIQAQHLLSPPHGSMPCGNRRNSSTWMCFKSKPIGCTRQGALKEWAGIQHF